MEQLGYFLMSFTSIKMIFLVCAGTFAGIYIGAIPGLSVTMAVSVLISFTFSWDVNEALCLMSGIYCGGVYGGSRSAILPESSLMFSSRDYFMLAIMGLLLVGSLSGESLAKGIFAGALGVFFSMIGMDTFTGMGRFTFGSVGLMSGGHFVAIMIGLFGVSEALVQHHDLHIAPIKQNVKNIIPSWRLLFKHLPLIIKSALIGIGIGALPGAGGAIAALMAYGSARRSIKNPTRPFGKGAYEGVIAPA